LIDIVTSAFIVVGLLSLIAMVAAVYCASRVRKQTKYVQSVADAMSEGKAPQPSKDLIAGWQHEIDTLPKGPRRDQYVDRMKRHLGKL
jgi:hypothetical protein